MNQSLSRLLWTDAITTLWMADGGGWTVTLATIGKAVVSSSAFATISANHIWLTVALATKRIAQMIFGAIDVALTRQCATIEIRGN